MHKSHTTMSTCNLVHPFGKGLFDRMKSKLEFNISNRHRNNHNKCKLNKFESKGSGLKLDKIGSTKPLLVHFGSFPVRTDRITMKNPEQVGLHCQGYTQSVTFWTIVEPHFWIKKFKVTFSILMMLNQTEKLPVLSSKIIYS